MTSSGYNKDYYLKNRERIRELAQKYYQRNREKILAKMREDSKQRKEFKKLPISVKRRIIEEKYTK